MPWRCTEVGRVLGPHFGVKAAAAEAAVTAAEAIAVADLEEVKRLAAEYEALGGGALAVAIAQEADPGDPLRISPIKLHMKLLHSFYHRSSSSWQYTRIVQFLNLHQ